MWLVLRDLSFWSTILFVFLLLRFSIKHVFTFSITMHLLKTVCNLIFTMVFCFSQGIPLGGSPCDGSNLCATDNATCINDTCVCSSTYYDDNAGNCNLSKYPLMIKLVFVCATFIVFLLSVILWIIIYYECNRAITDSVMAMWTFNHFSV